MFKKSKEQNRDTEQRTDVALCEIKDDGVYFDGVRVKGTLGAHQIIRTSDGLARISLEVCVRFPS